MFFSGCVFTAFSGTEMRKSSQFICVQSAEEAWTGWEGRPRGSITSNYQMHLGLDNMLDCTILISTQS